jgi:hypothetical protein
MHAPCRLHFGAPESFGSHRNCRFPLIFPTFGAHQRRIVGADNSAHAAPILEFSAPNRYK